MIRRLLSALVLGLLMAPMLPSGSAAACSAPAEFTTETFEAVAVSRDAQLWQFRLDDGSVRSVYIDASDAKQAITTSCTITGPPPQVGGRYVLEARVVGGQLSIVNIGGSFTELAAPPPSQVPELPAETPSGTRAAAVIGVIAGATLAGIGFLVLRRRRYSVSAPSYPDNAMHD